MSPGRRPFTVLAVLAVLALVLTVCLAGWSAWRSVRQEQQEGSARVPGAPAPGTAEASPPTAPTARPSESGEPDGNGGNGGALRGTVVVIDPGHNPGNREHTREIARRVDIGTGRKECDTTGTATDSGYAEAAFTLDVSRRARDILAERGARVVLTHDGDRPYGPCIDERAARGNAVDADAAVSVHADGSGDGNRGFHVIVPARVQKGDADTTGITGPSRLLGEELVDAFAAATGTGPAGYLGPAVAETGLVTRGDLGGLNLSRVPKVFLECGNMRDPRDSRLVTDPSWRQRAAEGLADGVTAFLRGSGSRPHAGTDNADPPDPAGRPSVR
ncbi:N-acetylmuramoyl-L-alanine amidase [Streptomyces sp. TRM 70361]|uniref:N-acetylmuramoyl-L-alanine amidase n=1 Tax=Streptomyces sp. TRM 70361 TaxID=3116553 RepID=UPI002E7AE66F|nr:N-acetylmuramoyl-L-alanine amidase [Streptomyces sp. TRM 70361]MEE1939841.1 N-acetylmuramoyl-L-alanine amidase [Streptomyces sp. TRM 70361]